MELKIISELQKPDTSYFKPWALEMLYQVEPELEAIAARTVSQKRRRIWMPIPPPRPPPTRCWAGAPVIHGFGVPGRGTAFLITS